VKQGAAWGKRRAAAPGRDQTSAATDDSAGLLEDAHRAAGPDRRQALRLLWRAARPDKREIVRGTLWLAVAGLLEALGPIFGKRFIDEYLLPRNFDGMAIALLIGGYLVTGWAASIIRYFQLLRLSGLAMRSVRRLREGVYGHVMRLPMAFFDRAITGQLVSRITNDTESIKQLYTQVLRIGLGASLQGLSRRSEKTLRSGIGSHRTAGGE
jgi:ATP-binding cassette subfamily B protein/ATP-binding cassette subfamily C protein/ATP-binding cassette subfamily B multidrug efflux pump